MRLEKRPSISASRLAIVFRESLSHRRIFFDDSEFFKVTDILDLLNDGDEFRVRTYKSSETERSNLKGGVISFGGRITLIADEKLLLNARAGDKQANFVLSHELTHLALGHHKTSAVIKRFRQSEREFDLATAPETAEELEANYGAVIFQCGVALLQPNVDPISLANRAHTDIYLTKKLVRICRLTTFRLELEKLSSRIERVVL